MVNSEDMNSADPKTPSNEISMQDTSSTQKVESILNSGGPIIPNAVIEGESYCIEVLRGPTKGDLIFLKDEKNTFGRGDDCQDITARLFRKMVILYLLISVQQMEPM